MKTVDAQAAPSPFSVNDPPPEAVASAMNYLTQMPWPRVFVDGALNSPFWLLKRDPDAAAASLAASERHRAAPPDDGGDPAA